MLPCLSDDFFPEGLSCDVEKGPSLVEEFGAVADAMGLLRLDVDGKAEELEDTCGRLLDMVFRVLNSDGHESVGFGDGSCWEGGSSDAELFELPCDDAVVVDEDEAAVIRWLIDDDDAVAGSDEGRCKLCSELIIVALRTPRGY